MSVATLFVKISGSIFNPAISFSLFLVGSLHFRRMGISHGNANVAMEFVAQFSGAIAGIYLLAAVTPFPMNVETTLVTPPNPPGIDKVSPPKINSS